MKKKQDKYVVYIVNIFLVALSWIEFLFWQG